MRKKFPWYLTQEKIDTLHTLLSHEVNFWREMARCSGDPSYASKKADEASDLIYDMLGQTSTRSFALHPERNR